jgi:nitrogen fixation NifU-like protein
LHNEKETQALYSEAFLDHFKNPRNVGELDPPALTVEISNPACGDILRLSARFEAGKIAGVSYKVRGCTASIASGSALTEWMKGKTRAELAALKPELVEAAVGGLIPESKHAAVLCVDGVKKLLSETRSEHEPHRNRS